MNAIAEALKRAGLITEDDIERVEKQEEPPPEPPEDEMPETLH